jgi:hypothetical protein
MGGHGLGSYVSGWGKVACRCEHGNEHSGSTHFGGSLDKLLASDCIPRSLPIKCRSHINNFVEVVFMRHTIFCSWWFLWHCDPTRARAVSFLRFLDYTQRRTTVSRTTLDEWSARRRDLYQTTHSTRVRQTSISPRGIRTPNLSRRAAADQRLRPHGQWDRRFIHLEKRVHYYCVTEILQSEEWHRTSDVFTAIFEQTRVHIPVEPYRTCRPANTHYGWLTPLG